MIGNLNRTDLHTGIGEKGGRNTVVNFISNENSGPTEMRTQG